METAETKPLELSAEEQALLAGNEFLQSVVTRLQSGEKTFTFSTETFDYFAEGPLSVFLIKIFRHFGRMDVHYDDQSRITTISLRGSDQSPHQVVDWEKAQAEAEEAGRLFVAEMREQFGLHLRLELTIGRERIS